MDEGELEKYLKEYEKNIIETIFQKTEIAWRSIFSGAR